MTIQEASAFSGISAQVLRRMIVAKKLYATKRGRDYWITEHSLMAFLELPRPAGRPHKR